MQARLLTTADLRAMEALVRSNTKLFLQPLPEENKFAIVVHHARRMETPEYKLFGAFDGTGMLLSFCIFKSWGDLTPPNFSLDEVWSTKLVPRAKTLDKNWHGDAFLAACNAGMYYFRDLGCDSFWHTRVLADAWSKTCKKIGDVIPTDSARPYAHAGYRLDEIYVILAGQQFPVGFDEKTVPIGVTKTMPQAHPTVDFEVVKFVRPT